MRAVRDGELVPAPVLDITDRVTCCGEQGLLGIAFSSDGRQLYLAFTRSEDEQQEVDELTMDGDDVDLDSRRTLLVVEDFAGNHNGGDLELGPDGYLYYSMGDGGGGGDPENRAQDLSSRLGKLLRLDVDQSSTDWEMIAYGLRNPWRFSFDRMTGDLWIGDVGQDSVEEIDFVGLPEIDVVHNFGWDVFEGSEPFENKVPAPGANLVDPVVEYSHDLGCSVTGGYVYRGKKLRRQAWGRYFFGDYCSGRIWSVARWNREYTRRGHPFQVPGLTSFAEDEDGELYLLSSDGTVHRLVARG